jgi:hypothetical protein
MKLPLEYRWLKANGFKGFVPWYLIEDIGQEAIRSEYKKETGRDFFPFARRQDNDDVAGFEIVDGEILDRVVSVHLTWTRNREQEGFPAQKTYSNMFDWLSKVVIPDTFGWMSEEDLDDLEEENA